MPNLVALNVQTESMSAKPLSDIEIARSVQAQHINTIAEKIGVNPSELEHYGKFKAKVPLHYIDPAKQQNSKLILVTAISPTPPGEGKTTTSIGLADGLSVVGCKTALALREPSLGPVFGIKGGAAGGGYAQVIPMEDINLHFTGDFSAIERANNLLAALIDNSIQSKKRSLNIDPRTVLWKRVMDMNDRALRQTLVALGGKANGVPRETGFNITAASEIMAILCLSKNREDLKERLANIYIGDTFSGEPVFARQLNAHGAMAALLKDAILPNLVQTLEGTPAFIHGGPFANIAQGTNSLLATKMAMSLADYVVTEAGFGADLGAEKFLNIKCRAGEIAPSAVVIVATVRALKYHGGQPLSDLTTENREALAKGMENLAKHIENIQSFGLPVVVGINRFTADSEAELNDITAFCASKGVECALNESWAKGGKGAVDLAEKVVKAAQQGAVNIEHTYSLNQSIEEKIEHIARKIYGADGVDYSATAKSQLKRLNQLGFDTLPICMAKTQKSFSDNEKWIGRPSGFKIHIREFEVAAGAGFIVPIAGNMMRMPGLPETPAAENIDIDKEGNISGLF